MKNVIRLITIIVMGLTLIACENVNNKKTSEKPIAEDVSKETIEPDDAVEYKIVKMEDQSSKALGKKPLSQYQTSELEKLPIKKKHLYRVVLKDIKENQVKPTVELIIKELTSVDKDIDEITLWLYSDNELSNSTYDIGAATWAPYGKLGNVDANIAKNNSRENYEISYQITRNLNEYLALRSETEDKFGFSVEVRKQIFKDLVKAQDKAGEYEHKEQQKVLNKYGNINDANREKIKAEYAKIYDKSAEKMSEYEAAVAKQYNISVEQLSEISSEAQEKFWPLD
ncbi:hypothetical protein H8S90_10440 [Olivibacter sp. SDN3]|uniref:hypothetical protein n=1 Tax=Olivibacter sp. SDN3 TaxID=2764720 RepID=UPI0016518A25|nr:hypothetical protein [Olivibacter sp. SDN3]QNL51952.1 hypothetical protein H8S90_10440 [Olivibacter sp. SDN3]